MHTVTAFNAILLALMSVILTTPGLLNADGITISLHDATNKI